MAFDLLGVIQSDGIEAGIAHYNKIKGDDAYDLDENELNQIGYQLMGSDQVEEALEVFELYIKAFPKSSNAYDSYAEAFMNLGRNDEAIENYKISVEMNPGNQNGLDMLKKLGVDTESLTEDVTVADALLQGYIGKYELSPGFVLAVSKEGSQMKAQATGQPMFDIFPKSDTVFYLKVVSAQITFNLDGNGSVKSLTLFQGGQEMTGAKLVQ